MESVPKSLVNGATFPQKLDLTLKFSKIPWQFPDILLYFQISLTVYKINWQFPDLEKISISLTFPLMCGNPESVNKIWFNSVHLFSRYEQKPISDIYQGP